MRLIIGLLILISATEVFSQNYSVFSESIKNLYAGGQQAEDQWNFLVRNNQIPLVVEDSVAFLYKGEATSVAWHGDFNGWGRDQNFKNKGTKIPNTNIWTLKASFPKDARLDYKILLNNSDWTIDPVNPNQQWSGVGGGSLNSELRMPDWKPDPITIYDDENPKGKIKEDILFNSKTLGYQITYSLYTPNGYSKTSTYPVLYVMDGYEYLHERMGNMGVILDNLIHQKKIKPIVVVFIDHRELVNRSNNRRMQELSMNSNYLDFIVNEFVPVVESNLNVSKDPSERGILGNSMGGLTSSYFAFSKPEIFGLAGIQSPAFWFKPAIYSFCDNAENPPVKVYLTSGSIHDAQEGALKMRSILEKNTCAYQYTETNQSHSWGNFRDTIDDILIYFFPPK